MPGRWKQQTRQSYLWLTRIMKDLLVLRRRLFLHLTAWNTTEESQKFLMSWTFNDQLQHVVVAEVQKMFIRGCWDPTVQPGVNTVGPISHRDDGRLWTGGSISLDRQSHRSAFRNLFYSLSSVDKLPITTTGSKSNMVDVLVLPVCSKRNFPIVSLSEEK